MGKGRVQLLELQGPGDSVIRLMSEEDLAQVCGNEPNITHKRALSLPQKETY